MSPLFRARTPKNRYLIEPDHLPLLVWFGLSCVLALLSMAAPEFGRTLRGGVLGVLAPFVDVVQTPMRVAAGGAEKIADLGAMQKELERLRSENTKLESWYHTAQRLQAENEQLRESAKRIDDPKASFVTARVVMDQDQAYLRTALIAAGRANGVTPGQAVLDGDALIGRVLEVSDHVARLLLVTDVSSRIPVMVEKTGQRAILAGTNHNTPELRYVPEDALIANGDRVVTSGHGGVFPPYLPVGVVKRDEKTKTYKVILFSDLGALDLVRIVNYRLKIDLPVPRRERTAPAVMTDLEGNKDDEEKPAKPQTDEPAAEAAATATDDAEEAQ